MNAGTSIPVPHPPYPAAAERLLRERSECFAHVRKRNTRCKATAELGAGPACLLGELDDEDFRAGGRDDAVVRDHAQNGRHVHRERVGGERRFAKAADVDGIV